jgi:anti-anti-sigma factor
MQIESETLDGGIVGIKLAGRMDVQGAQEIDLKFTAYTARQRAVVVDMSAVDFLASIGIRTLLLTAKAISQRGGKMVLLNPDANVTHILEMAGIDTLIPICRSVDEARSALCAQ